MALLLCDWQDPIQRCSPINNTETFLWFLIRDSYPVLTAERKPMSELYTVCVFSCSERVQGTVCHQYMQTALKTLFVGKQHIRGKAESFVKVCSLVWESMQPYEAEPAKCNSDIDLFGTAEGRKRDNSAIQIQETALSQARQIVPLVC